jgi:hypothetical protein
MNHRFKLLAFLFISSFLTVQAQPEKILENYKPVIDLSVRVLALLELENTELALSPDQATDLLPILTTLQTSDTLTNDEATAYFQQTTALFSEEQNQWLDSKAVEILEAQKGNRPSGGFGLAMRLMNNEPVNLVRDGFSKDALPQLVEMLEVKTG